MSKELVLHEEQVAAMVTDTARNAATQINSGAMKLVASDSWGDNAHRTWAFYIQDGVFIQAIGTIERYWGGLKMICSVMGGTPRTSFFLEDGSRTTNKNLRNKA